MWTKEALKAKHGDLFQEYRTALAQIARAQRDATCCVAACLGAQQAAQIFYGVVDLTLVSAEDLQRTHPEAPPLAELVALYREHAPGGAQASTVKAAAAGADLALERATAELEATRNLALGLYNLSLPQTPPSPAALAAAALAQAEPKPQA